MKKIFCFLLMFSLLLNCSIDISATALLQTPVAGAKVEGETFKAPGQQELKLVGAPNIPAKSCNESIGKNKAESRSNGKNKTVKSAELVEVIPVELEEYRPDEFDEDCDEGFAFSKMQLAKDIARYMVQSFVSDMKNFVKFYPVLKISSLLTLCAWGFPLFFLYKKTGIDVPAAYSRFAMNHDNWDIFFRNLYNVIPMTLASFMIKYGQEAYFKFKNK